LQTEPPCCVKLFCFLLPLFVWSVGTAEVVSSTDDYVVQAWDADSGLPQSSVMTMVQTPDGYLWLGTLLGGLARFDGSRFVNFHPGNTPELRSIEISKLLVDGGGTMWVGGVDGSLVSYRDGKFHFEMVSPHTPDTFLNSVVSWKTNDIVLSSIFGWLFHGVKVNGTNIWETFTPPQAPGRRRCEEDQEGVIWYQTPNRHLAQVRGKAVTVMNNPPGLRSPQVNVLFKDGAGRICVGTEKELAVWDGKTFVNMTPTNGEPELAVRDVAVCRDGSFWVRTDKKLSRCANRSWLTEVQGWDGQFRPSPRSVKLFTDTLGGVWLLNYGDGLWHIDRGGHVSRVDVQQGLPNLLIECWCEDREGNIWVGMTDGGLACIRPRVFHAVWPAEGLQNKSARSVCEGAEDAMWFSTAGHNVLRWQKDKDKDPFTIFTPPAQPEEGAEITILPAGPGKLWVGTVRNGLWLLETNGFKRPFASADINTVVRCLCLDRTGALWIGSEYGLFRWDQGALKKFSAADGFSPAYVLSLAEDPAGDIWLGTAAGELRRWRAGKFESFRPPDSAGDPKMLPAAMESDLRRFPYSGALFGRERFWSLHFDRDGTLWIGSLGGGLLRFADGRFTRFTTHAGLPNDYVSQILEDDQNRLWLGTRAGIVRVAKSELARFGRDANSPLNFITYGRYDGLPTLECSGGNQPGCWKSRDGRLWFTTVKGAGWIDPAALPFNRLPPPVQLEEVLVDGRQMTNNPVSPRPSGGRAPGQMRIAAGRHYFEFKFTALSFTSPEKVKFKWRLKGLEAGWVKGGDRRAASYSFLPPGSYQFEVQACNNDGVWSEPRVVTSLTVLPFFWQTWWFTIAAVLFLAAVLAAVYSVRIARLRALENLRLRIARDLHDEVGANLGTISLLSQMMEQTPSSTDATQVRSIAAQTVDTLRDIVWFIDPTHDRLSDLVARLHETARVMLPALEFQFEQAGDFDSTNLSLAFRRNVPPLFKETLHNLLKHAHATKVEIAVSRRGDEFQFCVRDNGVGFDPGQRHAGNGLKNLRRRAAEIGGTVKIDSRSGAGTTVAFAVPITRTRDWWPKKKELR